jgi:hypothetical protein
MKTGRFFWGAFFVVFGLLILLSNLDYLHVSWGYSWRLWPLLLIFWGLSKFTENKTVRVSLSSLNGIVLACMIFGFFSFQWFNDFSEDTDAPRYTQHLNEPFDSTVENAVFRFSGGAGRFIMGSTTSELIEAQTESGIGRYELDKSLDDGKASVYLRMRDRRTFRFFGHLRNRAEIRLNTNPSWEMRFDVGASKLDLDLSPYKTEKITIDAGASTISMRLGDRSEETNVRVKTGVSSVTIEIPSSVGCEIRDNAHVGSTDFDDFHETTENVFQSANYNSASKKIFIDVDAGVSSIRVRTY